MQEPSRRSAVFVGTLLAITSCAHPRAEQQPIVAATSSVETQAALDPTVIYHQMGLIATGTPLSFVGKIAYFATSSPDSTMVLASVSIPNRALSFVREGDSYRAPYEVHVILTQGTTPVTIPEPHAGPNPEYNGMGGSDAHES